MEVSVCPACVGRPPCGDAMRRMHVHDAVCQRVCRSNVTPVGFEPTQLALVELESTRLDHSGKVSYTMVFLRACYGDKRACRLTSAASITYTHVSHGRGT